MELVSAAERPEDPTPIDLLGTTRAGLIEAAQRRLPPRDRAAAGRLHRIAMREGRFDPGAAGMDAAGAARWQRAFALRLPEVVRVASEPTEWGADVHKAVLRTPDGLEHECVDIPIGARHSSLCISTQVGCAMACRFCETARMGKHRDLSAGEIVGQVVTARSTLGWSPRSLVFMGMGEALDNFDSVAQAMRVLTDSNGLSYARSRLTVCTVGHVDGIRRLAALGWSRLNLSVSLNAVDDPTRARLMPVAAQRWPLAELQSALRTYRQRANFQLGVHYCLMPGINDGAGTARGIAAFCAPLGRCLVQIIPYNPGSVPLTRAPSDEEVDSLVAELRQFGLRVRRRITKGRSVMAACGQLGDRAMAGRRS